MDAIIYIPAKEALRRYNRSDIRTLKAWAKAGELLYQVVRTRKREKWYFESPEARYNRTMGIV